MAAPVRPLTVDDHAAVRRLLIAAFGRPDEADLVARLRADGDAVLERVAVAPDAPGERGLLGHVMLSRLRAPADALALAPVAVEPAHQGAGHGGALVRAALVAAEAAGWRAVFLVGEPGYYARFGFSAAAAAGVESPYPPAYTLARALAPGGLDDLAGPLVFAPAFDALG